MKYDFFAEYSIKNSEDLDKLEILQNKYSDIKDVVLKIKLLTTALDSDREEAKEAHTNLLLRKSLARCNGKFKIPNEFRDKIKKKKIKGKNYLIFYGIMTETEKNGLSRDCNYKDVINELFIKSNQYYDEYIARIRNLTDRVSILSDDISFNNNLPDYSFLLELRIKLTRPYISKDDEVFHICDNPIKKDWVFKIPMVSSMTWKGNLRFAGIKYVEKKSTDKVNDRLALVRLFGHENETEKKFWLNKMTDEENKKYEAELKKYTKSGLLQGRLNFFPTYFNKISLEVINPSDRKTKAGTVPIFIESVPKGAEGTFHLLYCPFNLVITSDEPEKEVKKDIDVLVETIKSMFSDFGFGGKKKTYGCAEIIKGVKVIYKKDNLTQPKDISAIDELKNIFDGERK